MVKTAKNSEKRQRETMGSIARRLGNSEAHFIARIFCLYDGTAFGTPFECRGGKTNRYL